MYTYILGYDDIKQLNWLKQSTRNHFINLPNKQIEFRMGVMRLFYHPPFVLLGSAMSNN